MWVLVCVGVGGGAKIQGWGGVELNFLIVLEGRGVSEIVGLEGA